MIPVVVSPDTVPVDQQTKLTGVRGCFDVFHVTVAICELDLKLI
jgi:hypothetical protein